ncbi:MAG: TIGR04013 family B12-binding domain/radical SAM domain-containing protein [Candidatus Hodarchaeales archaeon]
METDNLKYLVLLRWDKITWYAYGALTASLAQHGIRYEIFKGDALSAIEEWVSQGFKVIYGESSRNMTLTGLEKRLHAISKRFDPSEVVSVIGGPQATGNPLPILQFGAKYVIIGEGEVTFPELIQFIIAHKFTNNLTPQIPGLAYFNARGEFICTSSRSRIDLNKFCPYSIKGTFPLHPPIEIMRGCVFRCRFCQVPYMYGNPKFRTLDTILKIVAHYYEYFHPLKPQVDIRFIAPNSLGYMEKKHGEPNIPALKELVRRIKKFDVRIFLGTFPSEVRPEYVTEDIISIFSEVDNSQLSVGFQSGSDRILRDMRRGHTVEAGMKAYDILTSNGFTPVFDFILGTPTETEADQWETLRLMRELGKKARVRLHYFMPLTGTPWANEKPAPLYPNVHSEIGRLAHDKILSGDFDRQMLLSQSK